ncbi:MAG: hypothetical protein AAGK78_00875 [Planctomycetota bacterium]
MKFRPNLSTAKLLAGAIKHAAALLVLLACLTFTGCAASGTRTEAWPDGPTGGTVVRTEHYALHTTVTDTEFQAKLAKTMEATHKLFEKLAPIDGESASTEDEPFVAYIFQRRDDFDAHTNATAGPAASTLLQIQYGGYALNDTFVTFRHGTAYTLSVCRHEGWHQYVDVHFKQRPPPFLEEGLATLFERGFEQDNLRFPRRDGKRHLHLVEAAKRKRLWSLGQILEMNAGHVIGGGGRQIDTFYAQAWALARMLVSDPKYSDRLENLLSVYARGEAVGRSRTDMFFNTLGVSREELADDYAAYVKEMTGVAQ